MNRQSVLLCGVVLAIAGCGQSGGPGAGAEADQAVTAQGARAISWERADLMTRSAEATIRLPGPGFVASFLATDLLKNQHNPLRTMVAPALAEHFTKPDLEESLATAKRNMLFAPYAETLDNDELREEADTWTNSFAESGASINEVFELMERDAGYTSAVVITQAASTVDPEIVQQGFAKMLVLQRIGSACHEATRAVRGWPVEVMKDPFSRDPTKEQSTQRRGYTYVTLVEQSILICAHASQLILDSIGPVAFRDPEAGRVAIARFLATLDTDKIDAILLAAEAAPARDVSMDFTGVSGHAWNSARGRYQNEGSGWKWGDRGLVMFDGLHLFGRAYELSFSQGATLENRSALSAEELQQFEATARASSSVRSGAN